MRLVPIIWTQDGTEDFLVCQEAEGVVAVGSYPQSLRSPVMEERRSGTMDNFHDLFFIQADPAGICLGNDLDPDGCLVQLRSQLTSP